MRNKIAAVIVWYNPIVEMVANIETYIDGVDIVFVVDNSLQVNTQCVDMLIKYPKIQYIGLGNNMGIAYALNAGAIAAHEKGYEWLLTMDQDSCFSESHIENMMSILPLVENSNKVGILAAVPSFAVQSEILCDIKWSFVETAYTSGNLVRLEAWSRAKGWNEELFIDSVDHDFDFRLQLLGYSVVKCNNVFFEHHLGNLKSYKFFGKKIFASTHHNYVRRYYITRNRLFLMKWYSDSFPLFMHDDRICFIKELIKIIIVEDDKYRKLKSVYRGYMDFKNNKKGKYKW